MPTTAAEIVFAHRAGRPIAETIAETFSRFEAHADPALFLSVRPLAAAERLQAGGPEGKPLWGVPFVIKDNIDVAGLPTTAACPAFAYNPARSAHVVERPEAAGAIPLAKTNLDQFATGLVGVRPPYGVPRNALDPALIPGGSSSGSATAVGAGLVPFSLGTDTAGSGRVPAALNGIVGLEPSLGALSARGLVPACRTLDTISIFALDVADAFAAFSAACGYDEADPYSRRFPAPVMSSAPPHARLAVPRADQLEFFGDALSARAFEADLARLRELGFSVEEIDFAPFAATARLLYEGPWVAERYAATKPLIVENPGALHPVTCAILESATKFDAVATFEA
jgi:allophanate hydrolase